MRIFIDNDGCPRLVRDLVLKTAERRGLTVFVVGNAFAKVPPHPLFKMIVVPGSFDAADDRIADDAVAGDLVITADIPLAARIVEKGALGLDPRGDLFDAQSVGERLATRNLMAELRSGGDVKGGGAPYGDGDKKRFADALDRVTAKAGK